MSWQTLVRDGAALKGWDGGQGAPVIFQHGLGGDNAQVAGVFPDEGFRRLTLECRTHGASDAGDPALFSIARFADDVLAFADARGVQRFALGGISMGAAIALRIAVKFPQRVSALILARPAWLWANAPDNMQSIAAAAPFVAKRDRQGFAETAAARHLAVHGPDNHASLMTFFNVPEAATRARLMAAIAADGPGVSEGDIRAIALPTLVLGTAEDWVHPLAVAHTLAALIPGARFTELPSKARDKTRHTDAFRDAVHRFLNQQGS